jgi:ribose-phosphate pyrophosphokinase
MADAARRASADRITAVIPYFGYSRQDRKDKSRVPISAKLVMNLLQSAGFNRVLCMDLHAAQIGGFTDLPFDHLSFKPLLVDAIRKHKIDVDMVVAPDIGAVKRADELGKSLKKNLAIVVKQRLNDTDVVVENFIGDVSGKNVVIVDDLTESVGTLTEAAKACRKRGAKDITLAVTHGCFTATGVQNLRNGIDKNLFTKVLYSNTVSTDWYENTLDHTDENVFNCLDVIRVDVAGLFAQAIRNIHTNTSVSELFTT